MVLTKIKTKLAAAGSEYLWLFITVSLAVIPHIPRIPVWIIIMFLLLAGWRILSGNRLRRPRFTDRLVKIAIAVIIITGILITYGTLTGRDAGISLLILLTGMKFLETANQRDFYITAYIGMFLLLTNFLYTQSILTALYMIAVVVIFAATLVTYNTDSEFLNARSRIMTAGSMVMQSLPLLLILFVLFPRLPGPLWGLPRDAHAGLSGIDDEMEPGSVSRLVLSNEIAFRAEFEGAIPATAQLYWRGPVLWQTDGVKWFPDKPRAYTADIEVTGDPFHYTVTLEPTQQPWLYGLEIPVQPPDNSRFTHDLQIRTQRPVSNRSRYAVTSYTSYTITQNEVTALAAGLQLPAGYHQQAITLGRSWRTQGLDDGQIVNTALRMFNEQEFYYTTTPPPLLQDSVDQFLFGTRRGFCEHYAAAFTVLMRAAGIPARIVTGYQGGSVNPIDGFLVVRQRDAHAWTEVWLHERGWTRVDPTAAVAPARIMQGIENALPEGIIDIPLGLQNIDTARNFWLRLRDTVEAINNRWNQWVLSYDARQQMQLLARIGMGNFDFRALGITLVLALALVFVVVYLWLLRQPVLDKDMARGLYDQFCIKLGKLGIKRIAHEGPLDFAARATRRRSDLARQINGITRLYIEIRYGDQIEQMEQLKLQVRTFKPARLTT